MLTAPSAETITRALGQFQIGVNSKQVLQIQQYMQLLLTWNEKINLTAIRDPLEILYRHFCECMYAAAAVPVENGRLADLGSGAGFPGLPLKIIRTDLQVLLVESHVKKATFIAEVIRQLGLKDARVRVDRYQDLGKDVAPLDYVCSRALGEFGAFLAWAHSEEIRARKVVLWVGSRDLEEIQGTEGWLWQEPIAIPQSLRRLLLVGTRTT